MRRISPGAAVAVLCALVYLAFPTRQYYWDGLSFAINIEHAQDWRELFNVHHLLYNFIGYAEYKLLGGSIRALYLMQWTNCLAGALLVWLAYRVFRSEGVPTANSAFCAAIAGFAATFWKFTTDADSYILANVFLAGAYLTLRRSTVRGGMLHVAAMMMHQLGALFYPVGLAVLWRRSKDRFWREAAVYTVVSAGGSLAAYAIAFYLSTGPKSSTLLEWLTYHSSIPFSFQFARNTGWLFLGTARLFAGGKLGPAAYIAALAALALLGLAAAYFLRSRDRKPAAALPRPWPLWIWLLAYITFLFVWEPYNTFYRLFYLVPLVGLLAVCTRHLGSRPLAYIAAALFVWNFAAYIYPNTRVRNNESLAFALDQQARWPPGTAVVYGYFVPDLWTISYFNPQVSWIPLDHPDPAALEHYRRQVARGGAQTYMDWTYLQRAGEAVPRFTFRIVPPARPDAAVESR